MKILYENGYDKYILGFAAFPLKGPHYMISQVDLYLLYVMYITVLTEYESYRYSTHTMYLIYTLSRVSGRESVKAMTPKNWRIFNSMYRV